MDTQRCLRIRKLVPFRYFQMMSSDCIINMQKRRFVLIIISLSVLFSIFQLYIIIDRHSSDLQKTSIIRFKCLIFLHSILLISLIGLLIVDDFYQGVWIVLSFSLFATFVIFSCQEDIKRFPEHDYFILLRGNKFKEPKEKTFLNIYFLTYMYSILTSLLLGFYLLVRYLVICYYQRQLLNRFYSVVQLRSYSEQLKGKECSICIAEFTENMSDGLYELKTCSHIFHVECIKEWVNISSTCPVCRASVFPRRSSQQIDF